MSENLTDYIAKDLQSRILNGKNIPEKLTLSVLAKHYQVSEMPVRVAIQRLLEDGILLKLENGRLIANAAKNAKRAKLSIAPAEAPKDWQDELARKFIELSFRGKEAPLKLAQCADGCGISHAAVHTIFHRLAGVGLLNHLPRRGWFVRPFRQSDLDAYLKVREALELLAVDSARDHFQTAELKRLLNLNHSSKANQTLKLDNSLHKYWIGLSENRYIQEFFDRQHSYFDTLLTHAGLARKEIELSKAGHRRILDAFIRQDWDAGRKELVEDIHRLRPLLMETIKKLSDS